MEIRKLTINDYEEIMKLWTRVKLPYKPKGRDSKKGNSVQMEAAPGFFLGAFESNRLIGTVVLSSDLRKGWINRLAVDSDYRNRGIAKALIEESEKTLRKHDVEIFAY